MPEATEAAGNNATMAPAGDDEGSAILGRGEPPPSKGS